MLTIAGGILIAFAVMATSRHLFKILVVLLLLWAYGHMAHGQTYGPGVRCAANQLGGQDCRLPSGELVRSRSNQVGGHDYYLPDGRVVHCRSNQLGGEDCDE